MGAYFLKKQARSPILEGFGRNIYALLSFSGQQYMRIENLVINCTARYPRTCRRTPFEVVVYELNYSSEDKDLMDLLRTKAEELVRQVNPGAANNSMHERSPERILADCIAGVVSEYFWKLYLNSEENVVSETEFDDASRQIDLKVISNNKKIEVRSSFPRNGIEFAICHPSYEFDVIGPYSNNYKPGEIQKDYYVRTLFHLYNPTDIISMISADSFKVYLTGGATWDMMIDNDYSKNKTLLPDFGLGVIQKASYRVVPFSKSKDTREIKRVIIEDQQVKN